MLSNFAMGVVSLASPQCAALVLITPPMGTMYIHVLRPPNFGPKGGFSYRIRTYFAVYKFSLYS